ncbi:unnamed protein product [Calypogeia fissa]
MFMEKLRCARRIIVHRLPHWHQEQQRTASQLPTTSEKGWGTEFLAQQVHCRQSSIVFALLEMDASQTLWSNIDVSIDPSVLSKRSSTTRWTSSEVHGLLLCNILTTSWPFVIKLITQIVATAETTKPNGYGDMQVTLKVDPTGKIKGTIHRKVLTGLEDGKLIEPEAILVIRRIFGKDKLLQRHCRNNAQIMLGSQGVCHGDEVFLTADSLGLVGVIYSSNFYRDAHCNTPKWRAIERDKLNCE